MVLLILCISWLTNKPTSDVEMKIYLKNVSGDSLIMYYSVKNNSQKKYSVKVDEISTLPDISPFTLYINENDSIPLSFYNPFHGYPKQPVYTVVMPNDSISGYFYINLKKLYQVKDILSLEQPHKITGKCSFQLIYYNKNLGKKKYKKIKAYSGAKRIKHHDPVSDTLRSNIIYYNYRL